MSTNPAAIKGANFRTSLDVYAIGRWVLCQEQQKVDSLLVESLVERNEHPFPDLYCFTRYLSPVVKSVAVGTKSDQVIERVSTAVGNVFHVM